MATKITQKPITTQVRFGCDTEGCIRGNTVNVPSTQPLDNAVRLEYAVDTATKNGTWQVEPVVACPDHIS